MLLITNHKPFPRRLSSKKATRVYFFPWACYNGDYHMADEQPKKRRGRPPGIKPPRGAAKQPPVSAIMAEIRALPDSDVPARLDKLRAEALRAYGEKDAASSLLITHADVARDQWLSMKHTIAMFMLGDALTDLANNETVVSGKFGNEHRAMNQKEKLDLQRRIRNASEMLDIIHGVPSKPAVAPSTQAVNIGQITQTIVQQPKGAYSPAALPAASDTTEGEIIHDDATGDADAADNADTDAK